MNLHYHCLFLMIIYSTVTSPSSLPAKNNENFLKTETVKEILSVEDLNKRLTEALAEALRLLAEALNKIAELEKICEASSITTTVSVPVPSSCLKDKLSYHQHGKVAGFETNPYGGQCGFKELPSEQAKKYFVAINGQHGWSNGAYCGACVKLRYIDGNELVGYIHDSCLDCPQNHWVLSSYLYQNLTGSEHGIGNYKLNPLIQNFKSFFCKNFLKGKSSRKNQLVSCPTEIEYINIMNHFFQESRIYLMQRL